MLEKALLQALLKADQALVLPANHGRGSNAHSFNHEGNRRSSVVMVGECDVLVCDFGSNVLFGPFLRRTFFQRYFRRGSAELFCHSEVGMLSVVQLRRKFQNTRVFHSSGGAKYMLKPRKRFETETWRKLHGLYNAVGPVRNPKEWVPRMFL